MKKLFKQGGIFSELRRTFAESPVEMLLAAYAFFIGCYLYHYNGGCPLTHDRFKAVVTIFPMVMVVAFLLNRLLGKMPSRAIYYASPLLLMPVWSLAMVERWTATSNFWVVQVIVALVFICYKLLRDNDDFINHILRLGAAAAVTAIATSLIYGAFAAIYASILYIFDLHWYSDPFAYGSMFVFIFGGVLGFLTLLRVWNDTEFRLNKVFTAIVNFIVTPALIIYTAILYIYFFKIAITWELPRGGVAYMVFAFSILAVIVKSIQPVLRRRMFKWFFDWFHVIALPLLVMFWAGCSERISSYGLTPWRISMVLCGIVMTVFIVMFFLRKWGRYLYATAFAVVLLLPFALLPRLEMGSFSARWQVDKVIELAHKLNILDQKGILVKERRPDSDTVYKAEYKKLYQNWEGLRSREAGSVDKLAVAISGDTSSVLYKDISDKQEDVLQDIAPKSIIPYMKGDEGRVETSSDNFVYLSTDRKGRKFDISSYKQIVVPEAASIGKDSIYFETIDFNLDKKKFVSDQLRKIGYPEGTGFDRDYLENHKDGLMVYDTDKYRFMFSSMSFDYDPKDSTITCMDVFLNAVLIK